MSSRPANGRKSWKQRGTTVATGSSRPGNKHFGRWFLTILLLVMLAGFAYWAWPRVRGQRHLIVSAIWATDQLTVPPLSFVREDIDALLQIPDVRSEDATGEGQDSASFAALADRMSKRAQNAKDSLIMYIAAHGGVADDDSAYLVCSDFGRTADGGRYPIRQLLDKVAQSPAGLKVMMLDVGRLNYDPRLGVIGNEFASRVANEVQQHADPNLWVLFAAGDPSGVAVSHRDRRSVFGRAVTAALRGDATRTEHGGNGDRFVDLREFTRFVQTACSQWFGAELPNYQNPLLVRGRHGVVAPDTIPNDERHRLVFVDLTQPVADEKSPDEKPPEKNPGEKKPAADPEKEKKESASAVLLRHPPSVLGLFQAPAADSDQSKSNTKPTAAEKPSDKAAEPGPTPTTEATKSNRTDAKEPGAAKSISPTPPAGSVPKEQIDSSKRVGDKITGATGLRLTLLTLWQERDRLRNREASGAVSPMDFAPHIWREAEAWMLYYEQRILGGRIAASSKADDAKDKEDVELRLRDMETLARDLEQLLAAMNGAVPPKSRDEKSVGDRLQSAWQRYLSERKPADDQFERQADQPRIDARQAARRLSDQLYNSVYFVRWFGNAANTLTDSPRYRDLIASYLDELAAVSRELRQLERAPLPAVDQSRLRQFVLRQQSIAGSEQKLVAELQAIERNAMDKWSEPLSQLRIDQLLSTPLLPAAPRGRLLDVLVDRATSQLPESKSAEIPGPHSEPRSPSMGLNRLQSWRRDCLQLEAKLIQLADQDSAQRIATLAQSLAASETADSESLRLRNAVREVRKFYEAVPRLLTSDLALHLVDPRDATAVDGKKFPLPAYRVELERPNELQLVPLATNLKLRQDQPTQLSVTLRATKRNLLDAPVKAGNGDNLVEIVPLPAVDLPAERGWYSKTLHWNVTIKAGSTGVRKNRSSIMLTAEGTDGLKVNASVDLDLPQPDEVNVLLTRLGSTTETGESQGDITLSVFSNRKTKFQCALVNQNDQPKTVNVTVYAIAPRPLAKSPIGKLDRSLRQSVYDAKSRVVLDAKPVARSEKPVELPAADPNKPSQERVLVNFINPNSAPPAAATAAAPAAGNPPATPSQPAPEPIHGLILEIADAKDNNRVWLKWIELEPLSPRDFLDITVGYDQRQQQIVARINPKKFDEQGRPELPAGKPVSITWEKSGARLPAEGKKNLAGEIDSAVPPYQAELSAEVEADGQDREVKIGIDDYPRAFLYRVNCRRDPTAPQVISGIDLDRETTAVKIESITGPKQNRVYHFLPDYSPPPPPTDDKAPKIEHRLQGKRVPALFRAPADDLIVTLQADAPWDAFRRDTDRVRVVLRENSATRVMRADRQLELTYVSCGPRGILEFESKVGDLAIHLSPGKLENVQSVIDADIQFLDQDAIDSIIVELDGDDPRIEDIKLPKMFPKDGKVSVTFLCRDYHDVERVTYGFSKDGSPTLVNGITAVVAPRLDDNKRHVFEMEIDLKDQPTGKRLLLAKVTDQVGHDSQLIFREVLIVDPKAKPEKGEIRGAIRYGPAKVNGSSFKMTIEGGDLGPTPVAVQPDGSFVIPNLPFADYTLKVSDGSFSGKSVPPKELKGVKPTDPKKPMNITVDVSGESK